MNHVILSDKPGSIAYCLKANKDVIDNNYADKTVSLQCYKNIIRDLIIAINDKPLDKKSKDTKKFLWALAQAKSKDNILTLVYNTWLAGDGLAVVKIK